MVVLAWLSLAEESGESSGVRPRAAEGSANTMPFILDAVRAYATVGEIAAAFRDVFGTYTERSVV